MTEADVQRLLTEKKIRTVSPDPETAQAELDVGRRHIASAERIMADDATLAFTALYDAMRKAIAAHLRSRGYRVTRGPGAHAKTGEYALAALDHLDIGSHLDEFDALRDLRNQSEYEALDVDGEGSARSARARVGDRRGDRARPLKALTSRRERSRRTIVRRRTTSSNQAWK